MIFVAFENDWALLIDGDLLAIGNAGLAKSYLANLIEIVLIFFFLAAHTAKGSLICNHFIV